MGVKVLGYYVDAGVTKDKAKAEDVFVLMENEGHRGKFLELYCPVGQHSELKDERYLKECTKVTVEDYKRIGKGYFTPGEYL